MFHNPGFYKHLKAVTKETSNLLHGIKFDGIDPSSRIDATIEKEASFITCVRYLVESYDIEWIRLLPNEERVAEIKKLILHHIKKYLGVPNLQNSTTWAGYLLPCYLNEFNESTFDIYYNGYEEYLSSTSSKPIKYQIVVALENFDCNFSLSTIALSSNIRIVSSDSTYYSDVIRECIPLYAGVMELETDMYEHPSFFLEIDYEMDKRKVPLECIEHLEFISLVEVKKVFKILRLYKEGSIACGLIYWCPKTPCDSPHNKDYILQYFGNCAEPNTYILQQDDTGKIQHLFEKCSNNSKNKIFPNSAIYYLDKGVIENDITDKLVNFAAALESFIVNGNEEIATQLAIRLAFFLEKDRQKCREIYKDIKKAYSFRNKIVHGDYHKIKNELELNEYCDKTEKYARQAITKWIDLLCEGKTIQDIHDLVEENIFT
jgi:hypothetical protein